MRVFFDTNVVLDVLCRRESFYAASAEAFALAELRKVDGLLSAVSFTTIYYLGCKLVGREQARTFITKLRDVFDVAACDSAVVNRAIDSGMADFEDAVQHFSAVQAGADYILTRNQPDFADAEIPVMTPAEFLAMHSLE